MYFAGKKAMSCQGETDALNLIPSERLVLCIVIGVFELGIFLDEWIIDEIRCW